MPPSAKKPGADPGPGLGRQILAPVAAVFLFLLVAAGAAGRHLFERPAMEHDLRRAERHAELAAAVFGVRLGQSTPRQIAGQFEAAGWEPPEFLAPSAVPAWQSPRFLPGGPSVEAWSEVRDAGGAPLGAVVIRCRADAAVFAARAVRAFAIVSCLAFVLLSGLAWLLLERRVTDRLRDFVADLQGRTAAPGGDAVNQARLAVEDLLARMRKEQEPQRRILEGHAEMVCTSSPDGTILAVNDAYCRFFGQTREKLAGSNYLDLIPTSDRGDAIASVRKLSRQNPVNFAEHRVLLPDGTTRWMRWRDTALFDDAGAVRNVLSFGMDISAEKELAEQIEGLRVAFGQMQSLAETGSLTWDFAADRMVWTPEARRLIGAGATGAASIDGLLAVIAPDDRRTVRRLFSDAKRLGRDFQHEFRVVLPDGSLRVLQGRAEVLADPKAKIVNQLTCTLRDITALRDAEAATKRELRFREAIEQSLAAGIVVSDPAGRNLLVNPAFCAMTGWTAGELVGCTAPYPYWPEEEIPEINGAFESAMAGLAPPEGFELKFCRKDGSRFDVLVRVAPLLDNNDVQLGWLGAVTDVSAIQQTRRDLQAANERLRIAQDVAEFGIWDWDPVRDTLHWDRQSFAMFGHPGATDAQKVWREVHGEAEQERLTRELKRLIAAGGKSGQDRIRARWPDGTVHDILSTYVILRDENKKAARVLGINRDITSAP